MPPEMTTALPRTKMPASPLRFALSQGWFNGCAADDDRRQNNHDGDASGSLVR
jgi:hypothetical protein